MFTFNKAIVFFNSLCYVDSRLCGKDMFLMQEVIEHMASFQLSQSIKNIFEVYRPKIIAMTTPDFNYNRFFEFMKEGELRHKDHKFEFTKDQAVNWANELAVKYNYEFSYEGIGQEKEGIFPSHGLIFKKL